MFHNNFFTREVLIIEKFINGLIYRERMPASIKPNLPMPLCQQMAIHELSKRMNNNFPYEITVG